MATQAREARPQPPQHQQKQPGLETSMNPEPLAMRDDYEGSGKLRGKVALITGGDSGIGRAVALHYAREGANVAIVYLDEDDDARETMRLLEGEEGVETLLIRGDVSDKEFCTHAVEQTVERFGQLDILVNNAAQQYPQDDAADIDTDQLERTFKVNVFGYMYMVQAALEHLGEGSAIVNTSSITGFRGHKTLVDYAGTKGAIRALTYSLAQQLVEKGIRVNGVAPGPVWTPLIPSSLSAEEVAKFGADTPMKRPAQPAEVAPAYVFLASADASYITGQFVHVNGGSYMV